MYSVAMSCENLENFHSRSLIRSYYGLNIVNEIGRCRRELLNESFGRDLSEHATTGNKHIAPWETRVSFTTLKTYKMYRLVNKIVRCQRWLEKLSSIPFRWNLKSTRAFDRFYRTTSNSWNSSNTSNHIEHIEPHRTHQNNQAEFNTRLIPRNKLQGWHYVEMKSLNGTTTW